MNRGFAFYFKNAMKSSSATIWKNKHILQLWTYFFAELLARVTVLFSAIFDLADIRQAKIAHKEEKMYIAEPLKVATKGKPFWTMVLTIIVEAFILLGGAMLIAVATGILYLIGFIVSNLVTVPWYTVWLFCVPGGLALLVYALIMVLIFSPTPYIIETNPDLGVYETIKICFDTMKSNGKATAFLNFFIPTLLELLMPAICGAGFYAVWRFVPAQYKLISYAGCMIVSVVFILLTIPMFDLAKKIAQKNLFEDIVLDPVNANKRTVGINIKACSGVKFDKSEIKNNLVLLFDETQSDSIPIPDSPARRRIKENAEKSKINAEKSFAKEENGRTQNPQPVAVQPAKEPPVAERPVKEPPFVYEQPSEPAETVSVHSVIEQLNEPATAETEEFDLDKFVPEKFDLDKFIDAQVAEAQFIKSAEPAAEKPAEPVQDKSAEPEPANAEQAPSQEQPVEVKPKRTRTTKPKTEVGGEDKPKTEGEGEEKPKRTRTTKPKTEIGGEEKSVTEGGSEEKPKRTRSTVKKTSE